MILFQINLVYLNKTKKKDIENKMPEHQDIQEKL